jgi:hypothetical protein
MKTLVNIGTDQDAVGMSQKAIMEILNTNNDQLTKQIAIQAMQKVFGSGNNSFSLCNFIAEALPKNKTKKVKE